MTNAKKAYWTHYFGLNNFKQSQLEDNRKAILNALGVLGEAQVDQIYDYLLKINQEEAQRLYEYGTITGTQKREFIKENTMSKRTIHRHLDNLLKSALVDHIGNKYLLADKIKKDVIYWSRDFGDSLLYKVMRSYSPHKFKFEQNIEELIKIFGVYVVSCLLEAARPPVHNDDSKMSTTDMLNRDRLVLSWISKVFNPQRMLEYFVAIMNNLNDNNDDTIWKDEKEHTFRQEKASDMRYERWMTFLLDKRFLMTSKFENLSFSDTADKPYYGIDIGTINKIMRVLEKKYNTYYNLLIELTKNYDIVEMTKNSEMEMTKRLCLDKKDIHLK